MRVALVLLAACGAAPSSPSPPTVPTADAAIAVDPDAPVTIAPPMCGDKEACHHEAEDREADGDFAAAAVAYGRACDLGDDASCFAQGLLLRGRIEPRDDTAAHGAFVKACDLGIADGCAQVGTDLLTGVGVAMDAAKGRAMLERACTGGSGLSCYNLGVSARDGTHGATKDAKAAYALFEQGCSRGMGAACTEQAMALSDGIGTKRDAKRAAALAEQACTLAAAQCYFAAELLQKAKRHKEARALLDKACGAGSIVACHNLAVMLWDGIGGAKDRPGSTRLFEKACDGGMTKDCGRGVCGTGLEDACKYPQ
jgi:TPR repeat protein